MKKLVAITCVLASIVAVPVAAPVFANSATNPLCGPDGPEGYKRPGGYCSQIDDNRSLHQGSDGGVDECWYLSDIVQRAQETNEAIQVAATYCES